MWTVVMENIPENHKLLARSTGKQDFPKDTEPQSPVSNQSASSVSRPADAVVAASSPALLLRFFFPTYWVYSPNCSTEPVWALRWLLID